MEEVLEMGMTTPCSFCIGLGVWGTVCVIDARDVATASFPQDFQSLERTPRVVRAKLDLPSDRQTMAALLWVFQWVRAHLGRHDTTIILPIHACICICQREWGR